MTIEEKIVHNIIIISGPSGAGEDSVISGLSKIIPIERVITTTTRTQRDGESEGSPYYFISKEDFENKIRENRFVEFAQEYNNYYGVTREELERVANSRKVGIWKIGYKGVMTAKEKFTGIYAIFLTVESLDILEKRIRERQAVTESYIQERMAYTKEWMKFESIYDATVVNKQNKLDTAIEDVQKLIENHRLKTIKKDHKVE